MLGKTVTPKAASEVKLISSGKILENNKTVGQCKLPFGEFTGGVIIMHVVVQPSLAKAKTGDFRCDFSYIYNFLSIDRSSLHFTFICFRLPFLHYSIVCQLVWSWS